MPRNADQAIGVELLHDDHVEVGFVSQDSLQLGWVVGIIAGRHSPAVGHVVLVEVTDATSRQEPITLHIS